MAKTYRVTVEFLFEGKRPKAERIRLDAEEWMGAKVDRVVVTRDPTLEEVARDPKVLESVACPQGFTAEDWVAFLGHYKAMVDEAYRRADLTRAKAARRPAKPRT